MAGKTVLAEAIIHARPPSYLSCASVARELDMSESTVRDLVEKGVLPKPLRLQGCVRWRWDDIQAALGGISAVGGVDSGDPYMTGAKNATSQR